MYVLWMFRLRRAKEKEACHAKLCDDIFDLTVFVKLQRNALAISLHLFQSRAAVPGARRNPFSDNIRSPNPTIVELSAEEMSPYLLSYDFGFR
jgi:hypothetical protein